MTTHIEKCTLEDIHRLQDISYETFNETFKHQNSPESMNHYLEKAFNLKQLEKNYPISLLNSFLSTLTMKLLDI